MKWERMILVAFAGNYIINTLLAGLVVGVLGQGASQGVLTPQYITLALLSAGFVAGITWWSFRTTARTLVQGVSFGVIGLVLAIVTTIVSATMGAIIQTGSFANVGTILAHIPGFLLTIPTLVLVFVWVVPAAIVGYASEQRPNIV
jgi:hypothetical protein